MRRHSKWLAPAMSVGMVPFLVVIALATASAAGPASRGYGQSRAGYTKTSKCRRVRAHGTIRFSNTTFPDNLNPFQTAEASPQQAINLMFVYDVVYDQNVHLVPEGLTKVPTPQNGLVRNGGKTIILQLRPNQHWNNGAAETSADIKFAWRVGMDKASGPACAFTCDVIKSIDLPNKYTAVLNLKRVFAPAVPSAFPGAGGFPGELPLSWPGGWRKNDAHAAAVKLYHVSTFNYESNRFPMNGPYVPVQFVPGDRIVLKPNRYFRRGNVCGAPTATYEFAYYANLQSMIDAASTGQTDLTTGYTEANYAALQRGASAHHRYTVSSILGFRYEHVEFNHDATYNGNTNPFHDVRVRLAVSLALSKVDIARGALGISRSAAQRIVANSPWFITPGLAQPFANRSIRGVWDPYAGRKHKGAFVQPGTKGAVKDAKRLLRAAGYAHGFSFDHYTLKSPFRVFASTIMAKQLRDRLGLTMNVFPTAPTALFGTWQEGGILVHGRFQTAELALLGDPDSNNWRFQMDCRRIARSSKVPAASINLNDAGICNRTIDSDFSRGAGTLDPQLRARYYGQIQSILAKEADWDSLWYLSGIVTVGKGIRNFKNTAVVTQLPDWNWWELHKVG